MNPEQAAALMERITATIVESALDWGEALLDAQERPDDETDALRARLHGQRMAELVAGIAKQIKPRKDLK